MRARGRGRERGRRKEREKLRRNLHIARRLEDRSYSWERVHFIWILIQRKQLKNNNGKFEHYVFYITYFKLIYEYLQGYDDNTLKGFSFRETYRYNCK